MPAHRSFSGAIRVPTQTFDDMIGAPVDGDNADPRWAPFAKLHEYLAKAYPLVCVLGPMLPL